MMDLATKKVVEGSAIVLHVHSSKSQRLTSSKPGWKWRSMMGSVSRAITQMQKETPVAYAIVVAFGSRVC